MNMSRHLIRSCLILVLAVLSLKAQENTASPESSAPLKYRMELVYIFEDNTQEFIFVVGNTGFKSVASLKKFLSALPEGATLEWAPGCIRMGGEPLLSSEQDMKEFKAFCAQKNIKFILIPSG